MRICLLGFRKGLAKELEKKNLSYIVVAENVKMRNLSAQLVCAQIPQSEKEVISLIKTHPAAFTKITHVIACGEGGVVAANLFRKALNLPSYPSQLIRACSDKLFMKRYLTKFRIPVTDFIGGDEAKAPEEIMQMLGPKLVAKELNNSGGKGQRIITRPEDLELKSNLLYEKFITDADEMSVESFIQESKIVFNSTTQYFEKGVTNIVPSRIDEEILTKVLSLNENVIKNLNIQNGMTHLEVYIQKDRITFGEVALRPPGGYIMKLIQDTTGINPWELYLKLHLGEKISPKKQNLGYAAAIILHPGAGICSAINGKDKVKALASFKFMRVKAKVGDIFSKRLGVGQEKAHIILANRSHSKLVEDILSARNELSFSLK